MYITTFIIDYIGFLRNKENKYFRQKFDSLN